MDDYDDGDLAMLALGRLGTSQWLPLIHEPVSEAAHRLVAAVTTLIGPMIPRERPLGSKGLAALGTSVGLILAGLMQRPLGTPFAAQRRHGAQWVYAVIGRSRFWTITEGLMAAGLVRQAADGISYPKSAGGFAGQATKLMATVSLARLAEARGVPMGDRSHWRVSRAAEQMPARRPKHAVIVTGWDGQTGVQTLSADDQRAFRHLSDDVERLNDHVARFSIRGCLRPVFRRIFRGGLLHGRLYAAGVENYQTCPQIDRLKLTIDGEPVSELDVSASALSVYLALQGVTVRTGDLYGLIDAPREAAKAFIIQTLGTGRPIKMWGHNTSLAVRATPVRQVREAVLAVFPSLSDLPAVLPPTLREHIPDERLEWAAGQYVVWVEARAVWRAIDSLMAVGVPALPVHDSLIVPQQFAEAARTALIEGYRVETGATVTVRDKRGS